jgi:hypothetical protein
MENIILNEKEATAELVKLADQLKAIAPATTSAFSVLQPRGANVVAGVIGEKVGVALGEARDKVVRAQRTAKFFGVQMWDAFKRTVEEKKKADVLWEQSVRAVKSEVK